MELTIGTPQNVSTGKNNDGLTKELEFLRSENYILKGRLRGCETLGTLLQESKEMNKKLTEEKLKLQQRLDDSLTKNEESQADKTNKDDTGIRQENPELLFTNTKEMNKKLSEVKPQQSLLDSIASYETKQSSTTIKDKTLTDMRKSAPLSVPMQESNTLDNFAPLNFNVSTSIPYQNDQASYQEFDSDKFQAAKFSAVKLDEYINAPYDSPNMTSFNNSRALSGPNSDGLLTFPSNFEDEGNMSSFDMKSVTESLSEEEFKRRTTACANYAIKMKSDNSQFKKLIKIVTEENKHLKSAVGNLRDENAKLLQKVKLLEHERDDLSPGSFVKDTWVHVNKDTDMEKEMLQGNAEGKLMRELKEANTAWREKWNSLERSHAVKNKQLQDKLTSVEEELEKTKSNHEKQLEEMDRMLLSAKSKYEEEQDSKSEILQELHMTKQKLTALQTQITSLESEKSNLNHSKLLLTIELDSLKNARERPSSGNSRTLEEKETEIMVLKEQITVFHEDFEKERRDRASAQTAKNQLKEENTKLMMEKESNRREANAMRQKVQELKSENSSKQSKIQSLNSEIQRSKQIIQELRQQCHQEFQIMNQAPQPNFYEAGNGFRAFGNTLPNQPTFEHLPGAWTCETCTYINYPVRTVCEICGYIRNVSAPNRRAQVYTEQNGQDLTPRGRTDLEVDTVM